MSNINKSCSSFYQFYCIFAHCTIMIVSPTAIDESSLCILLTYSYIQSLKLNTVLLHWHGSFFKLDNSDDIQYVLNFHYFKSICLSGSSSISRHDIVLESNPNFKKMTLILELNSFRAM